MVVYSVLLLPFGRFYTLRSRYDRALRVAERRLVRCGRTEGID
jgi:hypothetical protein